MYVPKAPEFAPYGKYREHTYPSTKWIDNGKDGLMRLEVRNEFPGPSGMEDAKA